MDAGADVLLADNQGKFIQIKIETFVIKKVWKDDNLKLVVYHQ